MNLIAVRNVYTPESTIGDLLVDHRLFCHTLEDVVRPAGAVKIYGKTAIPAGRYQVILSLWEKHQKITPLLLDVPGFLGIRLHGGETAADTEGCLLCAYEIVSEHQVRKRASDDLTDILRLSPGPHWIEIVNTYPYHGVSA